MTDETQLSAAFPSPLRPDLLSRGGEDDSPLEPILGGMLDEFRNHLRCLTAGTVQVRDRLPDLVASDLVPALVEMEASIENLNVLTSWMSAMTAMTAPGEQVISVLHDVIERALEMAKPWLRADVHVSIGSRVGAVRNRRGAVECALAAMIVNLARAAGATRGGVAQTSTKELRIDVISGRGMLAVEIESNGAKPPPSWRWLLAERLAALVGGTIEAFPDKVGVSLRFQ